MFSLAFAQLSEAFKYFIRKKVKEDAAWQRITVIFSGAEVRSIRWLLHLRCV